MSKVNYTERLHEFGYIDRLGRMIGAVCAAWEVVDENGVSFFYFNGRATRDGKRYGATQQDGRFATEHQRAVAMARYLQGACARAPKVRGATRAAITHGL